MLWLGVPDLLLAAEEGEATLLRPRVLPTLGLGTAGLFDRTAEVVCEGLRRGFRLFDTAQALEWYREEGLGWALRSCGPVDDVVVVTKVHPRSFERAAMRRAVRRSRELLFPDDPDRPLDVLLLHAPRCWPGHCSAAEETQSWQQGWRNLEQLRDEGAARHIGVSNFDAGLLRELLLLANRRVAVVQNWCVVGLCGLHSRDQDGPLSPGPTGAAASGRARHRLHGLQLPRHAVGRRQPRARGPHPTAGELATSVPPRDPHPHPQIARRHNVSVSRVVLSWLLQEGVTAIPRSASQEHIADNAALLSLPPFLTAEDMESIRRLDGSLD